MSSSNLTDSVESLINLTMNNTVTGPVDTWETRLQANWHRLISLSIASVLCVLVCCFSIFSKHITGDYKWFVLNEALANFLSAFGYITLILIVEIFLGPIQFRKLHSSSEPSLWLTIYMEAAVTLSDKFGRYAQMTTLLATISNRWMAIVHPKHYKIFMSARLIILYCTLCYLITIPCDVRWLGKLQVPGTVQQVILIGFEVIPWILSTILSGTIFFKIRNHMRVVDNVLDKRRLDESRSVLYSLMIQIAVPLLDKIPRYVIIYGRALGILTLEDVHNNPLLYIVSKINGVNFLYSNAYTCIVILITMPPYRKAVRSLISSIIKFCWRHLKPNIKLKTTGNTVAPEPHGMNAQLAGCTSDPQACIMINNSANSQ